jgi:hypothetical protein
MPILIRVDCGRTAVAGEVVGTGLSKVKAPPGSVCKAMPTSTEADYESIGGVVGIATNRAGCGSGIVEGVVARTAIR